MCIGMKSDRMSFGKGSFDHIIMFLIISCDEEGCLRIFLFQDIKNLSGIL